jgi:hypothetical protein
VTTTSDRSESPATKAGVAGALGIVPLIAVWTFFDGVIIGFPILVAATLWRPLMAFVIGATVWITLNLLTGRWIDREWESRVVGTRLETRLDKARSGERAQRAVARVANGSTLAFGVGAVLLSAGQMFALNRIAAGPPVSRSRRLAAAVSPAICWGGLYATFGFLLHEALTAV